MVLGILSYWVWQCWESQTGEKKKLVQAGGHREPKKTGILSPRLHSNIIYPHSRSSYFCLLSYLLLIILCVSVSVCSSVFVPYTYIQVPAEVRRGNVNHLTWVLGTKLLFSVSS